MPELTIQQAESMANEYLQDTPILKHSNRVATLARRIAKEAGMPKQKQILTQKAAVLHDVGKGLYPNLRYYKAAHPSVGYDMLKGLDFNVAMIVLYHHQFQARKYPENPISIPDELRDIAEIVALADKMDTYMSKGTNFNTALMYTRSEYEFKFVDATTSAYEKLKGHGLV